MFDNSFDIIDSHVHFWHYSKDDPEFAWINDEMEVLKKDLLPEDWVKYTEVLNTGRQCIAVQAPQSEQETMFLLSLAEKYDFIKGVVGWVDLKSDKIEERLKYFSQFPKLKGFRHILQAEPVETILSEAFLNGISFLAKYNFTYDILVFPRHLSNVLSMVSLFPEQKFVIDHLAKPDIKNQDFGAWEKDIKKIASWPKVYCKISGLITEVNWGKWKTKDYDKVLNIVFDAFGEDRIMFGSDWPVCLLSGKYEDTIKVVNENFMRLTSSQLEKLYNVNTSKFYNL